MRIPIDKNIRDMLVEESQRMEGGGNPTADELACVVERAFEISRRKNKDLQAEGIKRARQRDVVLGAQRRRNLKIGPIYTKSAYRDFFRKMTHQSFWVYHEQPLISG